MLELWYKTLAHQGNMCMVVTLAHQEIRVWLFFNDKKVWILYEGISFI